MLTVPTPGMGNHVCGVSYKESGSFVLAEDYLKLIIQLLCCLDSCFCSLPIRSLFLAMILERPQYRHGVSSCM